MIEKLKVLYVEDDPDWRKGLKDFFVGIDRIELCHCVATVEECFAVLSSEKIDVVVLDIILNHERESGLDAALDITIEYPKVKIIMLSSLQDDDDIFNEAFMNGAYDFLYKDEFEKLPNMIIEAMANQTSKYGERLKKLMFDKKANLLSERDCNLLKMILNGRTQMQISEDLHISLAAVKKQVSRLMKKFNWEKSSKELADRCSKWGLLD